MIVAFWRALPLAGRIASALALLAALVWAGLFVRGLFVGTAEIEADLATGQADAAIDSGKDAVGTVAGQSEKEAGRERAVDEMKGKVDEADNAGDAHAAGAGWLCEQFGVCDEE
jgi:nitrogen fixation protein FixH